MTRGWRLTPLAEDALAGIAAWTIRTFGRVQAARCQSLAAGVDGPARCSPDRLIDRLFPPPPRAA